MKEVRVELVFACVLALGFSIGISWTMYCAYKMAMKPNNTVNLGSEGFAEMSFPWMRVDSLDSIKSLYHTIDVIDTKNEEIGKCLLLNDELQFCSGDERKYHELIVHFGVQYLPEACPKRVLIVGGGDCLVLREVMKYPDVIVDVLELDDMVTRVSEKHFGADRMSKSPSVTWTYGNVRASVKKLKQKYDYIIVDTTETTDHNLETDTNAFYEDVRALLHVYGVLVKNGSSCETQMKSAFAYTMSYGYDSKAHAARYNFTLGASFDFKHKIVTTGIWYALNLKTVFYGPDDHFKFLKWTDTYKQTLMDRILV